MAKADDWKGPSQTGDFSFGALTGVGMSGSTGFSILGSIGRKILPQGFVKDITNPAWVEAYLGPSFAGSTVLLAYSAHLRWDFEKDSEFSLYALGGFGGRGGGDFHLRFGVGAFWRPNPAFQWRAELASDFVGIGASFPF
jgi:hypothetical protein